MDIIRNLVFVGLLVISLPASLGSQVSSLHRRQTIPTSLPGNWTSQGCFTDISTARTLAGAFYSDTTSMTIESCIQFCSTGGWIWAGVEFEKECYCDAIPQSTTSKVDISDCDLPCTGDASETCGGEDSMNLFYSGGVEPSIVQTVGTTGWTYQGCFTDDVSNRTLTRPVGINSGVTAETCTSVCQATGNYLKAGLEDGRECWCDNTIGNPGAQPAPEDECHTVCAADSTEWCGGVARISVYQFSPPTATPPTTQSCVSSNVANFTLNAVYTDPPSSGPSSVPLKVVLVELVPNIVWTILSACTSCCTDWPTFSLQNSVFRPQSISNPNSLMVSNTQVDGQSPSFVSSDPNPVGFQGYCSMNGTSGVPILAVNTRSDLWSLCVNNTANGRLDVVYSPVANSPDYTLEECSPVTIQML